MNRRKLLSFKGSSVRFILSEESVFHFLCLGVKLWLIGANEHRDLGPSLSSKEDGKSWCVEGCTNASFACSPLSWACSDWIRCSCSSSYLYRSYITAEWSCELQFCQALLLCPQPFASRKSLDCSTDQHCAINLKFINITHLVQAQGRGSIFFYFFFLWFVTVLVDPTFLLSSASRFEVK